MRRTAALLSLVFVLSLNAPGADAARAPAGAAACVGIFDPATVVALTEWTLLGIARLMELGDIVAEHFKEDVRRARDPHRLPPHVAPLRLPRPLRPVPVLPPARSTGARPIVDTLPARPAS